jgi:hypothetical protein
MNHMATTPQNHTIATKQNHTTTMPQNCMKTTTKTIILIVKPIKIQF